MALNVGELEAVLRLKDEFSTRLAKAEAQLDSLNKSIDGPNKSFAGLGSTVAGVGRALGVTLSAGVLLQFGQAIIQDAAHVRDLSEQLAVNVEWFERAGAAAMAGGGSYADAAASVTFMQKAIAGGDSSVVAALQLMGLELNAVQQMGTEKAFTTIADAARTIPDPIRQTDAVLTLLGRSANTLLPSIRDGFSEVAASARVMATETNAALDRIDKVATRVWSGVKTTAGEVMVQILNAAAVTFPAIADIISHAELEPKKYGDVMLAAAQQSQAAMEIIRKGWAELQMAIAESSAEGFQQRKAIAETARAIELREISESILSAEEKNARLTAVEQKYSADLLRIKTDSARAVRDLQEQVGLAMVQRQGQLLQAQLALELSQAALSRGTAESIAAAKAAITTKYAGEEYNAKVASLDALEQLEMIRADREIENAEDKAAALLAIHQDYEQQRQLLAIQSATELNAQVEQLEAAHIARMAALGSASVAGGTPSTLTPAEQAAQLQHQAALGGLEGAQKQALALGNMEQAQRLQQLIDEEMNIFVAAMAEAGAATNALTPAVAGATTAMSGAQTAANSMATALHLTAAALNRPKAGDSVAPYPTGGNVVLDVSGAGGFHSNISDPMGSLTSYGNGGPVPSDGPIFAHAGEIVVPRNGMLVAEGGGGSTTVNVSLSGVLLSSDPMARMALEDAINAAVMDALSPTRKLGNR